MAEASVPNNFTNGTDSDAEQVDANFAALVAFINTNLIQADGSKAFTAVPTLPNADPSSGNHAARKTYVDNADKQRVKHYSSFGAVAPYGATGPAVGTQLLVSAGTATITTNGTGDVTLTFNFPNGMLFVMAQPVEHTDSAHYAKPHSSGSKNSIAVRVLKGDGGVFVGTTKLSFFALGW